MASGGAESEMAEIRKRYRLIALMGLSGDIIVLAAMWLSGVLSQDILLIITLVLLASGGSMAFLFAKVFPDRIAKAKGLT